MQKIKPIMAKRTFIVLTLLLGGMAASIMSGCRPIGTENPDDSPKDSLIVEIDSTVDVIDSFPVNPSETAELELPDSTYHRISLQSAITGVQPMTGLILWPDAAKDRNATYGRSISLEFSYCLPCKVVTGKENGQIQYDWTWFDNLLNDIASRNHQAVVRFRYEYPNSRDVDGQRGTTAVPDYIKNLPDYTETFSQNPGGDGPTYYADWTNEELKWFTKQFYTDLAARYAHDNRIAFLEVGFGHWSEYHIYGTPLRLGINFPSKEYQKEFFLHLSQVMPIPWLVSIDAADDSYSPVVKDATLMALTFGNFDDSFMHKDHEIGSADGYNERYWKAIGKGVRWQTGVCGGEVSYYTDNDQKNFLNPTGMYGHTWEEMAAKYHITFMIANDALSGRYGTAERFKEASMASGYRFKVLSAITSDQETRLLVTNTGIAPIYKDAFFAVSDTRAAESLNGLLPGAMMVMHIPAGLTSPDQLHILCDYILPSQKIEFLAD